MIEEKNEENLVEETKEETSTIFDTPREVTVKKKNGNLKKTWTIILLVIIIAAILCVAVYGVTHWIPSSNDVSNNSTTSEVTCDPLVNKYGKDGDTGVIASLSITNDEGNYEICPNDEGIMIVKEYADLPHATSSVDDLLSNFLTITPAAIIKENATDEEMKNCGLDHSPYEATISYTDGDSFSIVIGNLEPGEKQNYYACVKGQRTIYLVNAALYQAIDTDKLSLLSTTLVATPTPSSDDTTGVAKVVQMDLYGAIRDRAISMRYINDEDAQSVKMAGNMVIVSPFYRGIDTELTQEWDTNLVSLTAMNVYKPHPTSDDLLKCGLTPSKSICDLTVAIRKTTDEDGKDLEKVKTYNKITYTIHLGNLNEDGNYYAMVDGIDILYIVNPETVPWALCTYDDLVTDTLFLRYITDISKISISIDGKESVIHLKHGQTDNSEGTSTVATLKATIDGKEYDEASTRSIYSSMMMIQRITGDPGDAKATGTPALQLKLIGLIQNDLEDTDISFYPYSANRYLCVSSDGDQYLVKASDVENFITKANQYLSGQTIA